MREGEVTPAKESGYDSPGALADAQGSVKHRVSERQKWLQAGLILLVLAVASLVDRMAGQARPLFAPLVGIGAVIIFTLSPLKLPCGTREFSLDMKTMPLLTIVALLFGGMAPRLLWEAPIGTAVLSPLKVMVIFYGMAYICLSVNETGLLRLIGLLAAARTHSPGQAYFFVAILTGALTLVASNDIVILSLTPIITYVCEDKGYDPYPLLYLEFVAANVWSICLLTGNPTNVIAASAAGFKFSRYMLIHAPAGAVGGLAAAGVIFVRFFRKLRTPGAPGSRAAPRWEGEGPAPNASLSQEAPVALQRMRASISAVRLLLLLTFASLDGLHGVPLWVSVAAASVVAVASDTLMDIVGVNNTRTAVKTTLASLPWEVLPFALSLFIIVQALDDAGLVCVLARGMARVAARGQVTTVFTTGCLSILACQVLNNQPMTVLFTKILTHPEFVAGPIERVAAFSSLIIGSNLGANLTVIGALAGPMWVKVCQCNGLEISFGRFFVVMMSITPLVAAASFALLSAELHVFGPSLAGEHVHLASVEAAGHCMVIDKATVSAGMFLLSVCGASAALVAVVRWRAHTRPNS